MSNHLVAYFSATGTTERAARNLAEALDADLYEIVPDVPYSAADLNWHDAKSRSSVEMNDRAARPALAATDAPVANANTVFVGFPIWWYTAPRIIDSFLEAYDFSGKKVVLFATSGGSGLGSSARDVAPSAPGAEVVNGFMLNRRYTADELREMAARF